jgi:hypothetical protein
MLTQEWLCQLVNYNHESGRLICKSSGLVVGRPHRLHNKLYWRSNIKGIRALEHRLIWLLIYGYMPKYIDHKNGDGMDNRLNNLRECTMSQNLGNSKQKSYRGVEAHGDYYRVRIWKENKRIEIGKYETLKEANLAAIKAHKELFGEFSVHNR